jgi:hypothetical protein
MRHEVIFYDAINKETKYYGLKLKGLVAGGACGIISCIVFNFTVGILGCAAGYMIGDYVSGCAVRGELQRLCYRLFPVDSLFGGKYLPPCYKEYFI